MSRRTKPVEARVEALDRVLHEKARLAILASLLSRPEGLRFVELKPACGLTDGNLNRHVQVLHEAGLVEIWKGFEGRRPQTIYRLTPAGRERFVAYLHELELVVRDALAAEREAGREPPGLPAGWVPV